jgi:DNA-binding transcriptional LysR family regulator
MTPSPIELRLWRQFVTVAEELHFGRAAVRLHMTQPPLTMDTEPLVVALPEQHRLAVHVEPDLAEVLAEPLVMFPHGRLLT